ncbi:tyrosinase [Sodiomyces alkalinus F11]|uniref:Tyrosinase n=1 Tax=Sodiomyces alkalinus (strain CBS 110278 / VKM F-3762 / F11) TaxID=1314773 RepID=A0A3N2PK16_SODAK|nr:tyrosinase [Sodiomyces alkalinus F11]ROT34867.1 tyrosinase [Sodiomyces alkalinus F11]
MFLPLFCVGLAALASIPWTAAQSTHPVVGVSSGINPGTGETPARRNINDIYREAGPEWDLLVGALSAMQAANETHPLSYFQIMGIHGQPIMAWPGGGPQQGGTRGYCPHNEPLFGTWHRGYLALYEQVLVAQAQRIAEGYPPNVRGEYREAADRLRVPYWDWAADSNVPPATTPPTVTIRRPVNGSLTALPVRNPLASYTYPRSAQNGEFGRFIGVGRTERCTQEGRSYPESANEAMAQQGLRERVYTSLTRARSWSEISSTSVGPNSIEGPHGNVHLHAACGNDFLGVETAGFDPLFMLHHCNVDRLLAYWQTLNYENASVEFEYQTRGLFATPRGTTVTERSPLVPFEGPDGPLNSEDFASARGWGYTYEPLRHWDQSPPQLRTAVTRTINELYGPVPSRNSPSGGMLSRFRGGAKRDYFATVEVERSELDLPAVLNLFVRGRHAGTVALLGMPAEGVSYDEIPLQRAISLAGLADLDQEDLLYALTKDLQIQITKPDGTIIPVESVPSLKVDVENVDVMLPTSMDELPLYGEPHSRRVRLRVLGLDLGLSLKLPF